MMANTIAGDRQPLAQDHPLIEWEHEAMAEITQALENVRESRDAARERLFTALYGG